MLVGKEGTELDPEYNSTLKNMEPPLYVFRFQIVGLYRSGSGWKTTEKWGTAPDGNQTSSIWYIL